MIYSLNKATDDNSITYLCNSLGHTSNPKDSSDMRIYAPESFLTDEELDLYHNALKKISGYGHLLRVNGELAFGLCYPFKEGYFEAEAYKVKEKQGDGQEIGDEEMRSVWMPRLLRSIFSAAKRFQSRFPDCDFYIGNDTDPEGHELLVTVPCGKRDELKAIEDALNDELFFAVKDLFQSDTAWVRGKFLIEEVEETFTEDEIRVLAEEMFTAKDHNIYLIDLGGSLGYSCLVFKDGHSVYYANGYAFHYPNKDKEHLRFLYEGRMNRILFTDEELGEPLKSYYEYHRKDYFLRNYYVMRTDRVSVFGFYRDENDVENFKKKTEGMFYDSVGYAYVKDEAFVKRHMELADKLKAALDATLEDYDFWKGAFLTEMKNHEYAYNSQPDYDVLSCFGRINASDEDPEVYFEKLNFNETQKKAYYDARKEYYKEAKL